MDNKSNYIATSSIYPPEVLLVAEFLTVVACLWLGFEVIRLFVFFSKHVDRLTSLLRFEFFTKGLYGLTTLFMGLFLFIDLAEGVKTVVIIRPLIVCLSAYALHLLYKFYKKEL